MSNDIHQLPQCTCSALFLSSDALNVHLQEYQARESYLSAQQEICRSHSKANDDDDDLDRDDDDDPDVYEDGDSPAIRHDNGDKTHNCPLRECDRNIPFKTRQRLRRHFEQHVKCEEVCVYCHQISRRVSDYVRHAKRHRDVGKIKATYINQMCDELRNRAANELGLAESELSRVERRSKKRARDEGYIDSRTSGAQNAELHTLDMTIMNEFDFQPANGIDPLQISSLDSHQTRYTSSPPLHAVGHNTYASLKCCRARSHRRLSEHVKRGILPRAY